MKLERVVSLLIFSKIGIFSKSNIVNSNNNYNKRAILKCHFEIYVKIKINKYSAYMETTYKRDISKGLIIWHSRNKQEEKDKNRKTYITFLISKSI